MAGFERSIIVATLVTLFAAPLAAMAESHAEWLRHARIGGLYLEPDASSSEIDDLLADYADQLVSVVELDSGLSDYLDASDFERQLAHIDLVSRRAHLLGMKVVIYIPSLEVVTPGGLEASSSMAKDHPDWLQVGLDGSPNVFYGTEEHWIANGAESAWMSASSKGYRDYFIGRITALARTAVDGVWIDVPLYLDTGVQWSDNHPDAIAAFEEWSSSNGYDYSGPPPEENMDDPKFRHWLLWRNHSLAEFIDDVRAAALAENPDLGFVTEVYPIDYLDTIWTGLEPAVLKRADNSIVVWELDGVSDALGMDYAELEDFSNLIAMTKMTRAYDRGRPGWGFSYGNEPVDAGLVMASVIAEGVAPFETKTPIMTSSVDPDFRRTWFEFVRDNQAALFDSGRIADVGIWFSPATKTFHDFAEGGVYAMYLDLEPPEGVEDWWGMLPELSLRRTDHLAGWRGAAYALNEMHIPYKAVVDPGDPKTEMQGVSMMWLPSVAALSDSSAELLRDFVRNGGTLLATGLEPGTMDETGEWRDASNLADVFGFKAAPTRGRFAEFFGIEPETVDQGPRMQPYGSGMAIYRPDIRGVNFFETGGTESAPGLKERNHGQAEQLVRIHTPARIIADELPEGVYVTVSEATPSEQHVFVLNYSGLEQPATLKPIAAPFHYRPPAGFRVASAEIRQPGKAAGNGPIPVARSGDSTWMVEPRIDQFAILTFRLETAPTVTPPVPPPLVFATQEREQAVRDALNFVVNRLRHMLAPWPYQYGIHTNLLDNDEDTRVYTGGHHVTDEHMGLFLRVTALLQDEDRYREALEFVQHALFSRGYHVLAWSMHKDKLKPFLQEDNIYGNDVWMAANAPLDDLRSVRGLFDGAAAFGDRGSAELAHSVLNGLYWTTVTDRIRGKRISRPKYPGGILGYSWDWEDHDDDALDPPAVGTGRGRLGTDLIPVDYQDLGTLAFGARENPRLRSVVASAVDLMLAAEIPDSPGLFYNGLDEFDQWTGDFEFPGERQGKNLKVIQELWIALHLARVSGADAFVLDADRRRAARAAAERSFDFFRNFYVSNGSRVPEYLTFSGLDVPDGDSGSRLTRGLENLFRGEARIYSQLARLALLFGDRAFAARVIEEKILTDRVTDPDSPLYGFIGASTASDDDAEAFNVLESLLTLVLEAQTDAAAVSNSAPVANPDTLAAGLNSPLLIPAVNLLGNDTDADGDVLFVTELAPLTTQGGTVERQGNRWRYVPRPGFVGDDTAEYWVTDGPHVVKSIVTLQVTPGGGFAADIVEDGNLADWPAMHFSIDDPDDISGEANLIDIREIHLAVHDDRLYVGYENDGPVVFNWAYMLYIDSDEDSSTGFQVGNIGADYVLDEAELKIYTGSGTDWQWERKGTAGLGIAGDTVELSVPLRLFDGASALRLYFLGDNLAYEPNGTGEDAVPDPAADDRWIEFDLSLSQGQLSDSSATEFQLPN